MSRFAVIYFAVFFPLHWLLVPAAAHGATDRTSLSVEDYLRQVERADPGYRSYVQAASASFATAEKSKLLFQPEFYTKLLYIDNTLDTQAPSIDGTTNIKRNAEAGIRGQTPFGLSLSISFNINQSSLFNANPLIVTAPNLTSTYVNPQFQISLWQNFLGHADRANQKVLAAQDLAEAYGKAFQARATLVDAEGRYWKLAVTRELARVQGESVERAKEILRFDSLKVGKHLIDDTDLLPARSALKAKELDLLSIQEEELEASRALNAARGENSPNVAEELRLPDPLLLQQLVAPTRIARRGDVRAAEQISFAKSAGSELARERLQPELNLWGSIFAYGLNFTLPLGFGTRSSIRNAYVIQAAAADLEFQRKTQDEDNEWNTLAIKFAIAQKRLTTLLELKDLQRAKFENARKRRVRGLTIGDQVIQYELEYLASTLALVQTEGTILGLRAQMRLYEEAP